MTETKKTHCSPLSSEEFQLPWDGTKPFAVDGAGGTSSSDEDDSYVVTPQI